MNSLPLSAYASKLTRPAALPLSAILLLTLFVLQQSLRTVTPVPSVPNYSSLVSRFGQLPLSFIPNVGQTDPGVQYQVRSLAGTLSFTPKDVVLSLSAPQAGSTDRTFESTYKVAASGSNAASEAIRVRLGFDGANPAPEIVSGQRLAGTVNYLIGNDPQGWYTDLPTYSGVTYKQLYPGIDLSYDGTEGLLKGTYLIAPGVDPAQIRWRYDNATSVRVDQTTGDLRIALPVLFTKATGPAVNNFYLIEHAPIAWQDINNQRIPVEARYSIAANGSIGFELGDYDRTQPLTIDPTLTYSTFLGGSGFEEGIGIAVDDTGNTYLTGRTHSVDFPTVNPVDASFAGSCLPDSWCYDVFTTKLAPDGSVVYSTYLGGGGHDEVYDLAVDGEGGAYLTGRTNSIDFPSVDSVQETCATNIDSGEAYCLDAFVTKLSAHGVLVYSTFLGGEYSEWGYGIAVDRERNAYITGTTNSIDFPTANALYEDCQDIPFSSSCQDVFISKLNADGSALLYSTYLGGTSGEDAFGIALDAAGNAYITGRTWSLDFPTLNPLQPPVAIDDQSSGDVFVTKINTTGEQLVYSTYLGGSDHEEGFSIAVDTKGNAYVTGFTYSNDFPTKNAFQPSLSVPGGNGGIDAFVTKLNADGSALVYSSFLGGGIGSEHFSETDFGHSIAVDSAGYAYVTGQTYAVSFPTINPLMRDQGNNDIFVAKVHTNGLSLVYSTYLGGSEIDEGYDIAVDSSGTAYVTGVTYSADFPTANPLQPFEGNPDHGLSDAFIAKIATPGNAPIVQEIVAPLDPIRVNTPIQVAGSFTDPEALDTHTAVWEWGDGASSVGALIDGQNGFGTVTGSHTYTAPGVYTITLRVTDNNGGSGESQFEYIVVYNPEAGFVAGNGWIHSPAGAYTTDSSLQGRAIFGFNSRYQNGATVPTGQTNFHFHAGNLRFRSLNYQWLVVAGAKAQFKGIGTINGIGNYGFMVTAIDGQYNGESGSDRLRVRIWDRDNGDRVVYDNLLGVANDASPTTTVGGGSILIQK